MDLSLKKYIFLNEGQLPPLYYTYTLMLISLSGVIKVIVLFSSEMIVNCAHVHYQLKQLKIRNKLEMELINFHQNLQLINFEF